MIKSTTEKHTAGWLLRISNNNKLDFTISIQRKEVWDRKHKSNFIAALLCGIPIESFLFEEDKDDNYYVIDGKQRSLTILSFMRDEFEISTKCRISKIGKEEIIGKKYSELSVNLQETLKEYELSIQIMRPLTEDERELVFFMRNQAIPLTNMELVRVALGSKALKIMQELSEHPFIEKANISQNRYQHQQVVLECCILESGQECNFIGENLINFASALKNDGLDKSIKNDVKKVFDFLDSSLPEKKSYLRKVHIPAVYMVAKKAMEEKYNSKKFEQWLEKFFEDIKGSDNKYTKAADSGINQWKNINIRITFMIKHFEENSRLF